MRMHDSIAQTGISGQCFTAGNEGEELLIWNRGELSRASPLQLTLCPPSIKDHLHDATNTD